MPAPERYSRQAGLVPAERLETMKVAVIGVGAIGRQAALQLASIGVNRLELIDFDIVEESNIASQGYGEEDLGRYKVDAAADAALRINGSLDAQCVSDRFRRSMVLGDALFCCVDRIDTRRLIWEAAKGSVLFFCDGRMAAEAVRILTAADEAGRRHYPTTLFASREAHQGACTARSTVYAASIAAGLMVGQFTRFLRGLPTDADLQFNILTSEITCLP